MLIAVMVVTGLVADICAAFAGRTKLAPKWPCLVISGICTTVAFVIAVKLLGQLGTWDSGRDPVLQMVVLGVLILVSLGVPYLGYHRDSKRVEKFLTWQRRRRDTRALRSVR